MIIDPNTGQIRVFEPGDWICWQQMSGLTIAEIHYVRTPETYPFRTELVTSKGVCHQGGVLECRTREGLVILSTEQ